jgi:DNA modification methylase
LNWQILNGDVRDMLREMPPGSVQTCVTSPPYWGLRDYGHAGQIGLEATPAAFVAAIVDVFSLVRNALADDGTLWLNLGDSYAGSGKGPSNEGSKQRTNEGSLVSNHRNPAQFTSGQAPTTWLSVPAGLKGKDLVGIPWRVAFALQADGWYLRSDIIWSKPNPMPESVTDRPTKAHEYIFLLSKSARYYYDADAICETAIRGGEVYRPSLTTMSRGQAIGAGRTMSGNALKDELVVGDTRNKRSVWHVATQPYPDAHFATYPEALIDPCILAGSKPGDTVLDPFCGSGTTGAVSLRHQRNFIGIELNPAYVELARKRIGSVAPLFSSERTA